MIDFKPIKAEDYHRVSPLLKKSGIENCEHCFSTMLVWSHRHPVEIAVVEDTVFMRSEGVEHTWYIYPGGPMDSKKAVELIIEDSKTFGNKINIYGIDDAGAEFLKENFSHILTVEEDRDSRDYIYLYEDLANLPGKKYQKKRNHCSRFERENPDYSLIPITGENVHIAKQFELDWCAKYSGVRERDLVSEQKGIIELLDNFERLELMGAMIKTGDEIVAMSIAAPISDDMVDVMVEKAYHDVNGAYAVINRDFVRACFSSFNYINREDDMGIENLRKAKLSYFPFEIKKKYLAHNI